MKFGKLPDISNVDFTLPSDRPETGRLLNNQKKKEQKPSLYVGCTGWGMKEWIGKVYQKGTKPADFLFHYSRQFSTVELNATHYGTPSLDTIKKWRDAVPKEDFVFCPKILQRISHSNDLGMGNEWLDQFCSAILGMEKSLGCCFMQLPPYFKRERLSVLERFLEQFPKEIPLAVEVRHESWFNNNEHFTALFDLLEAQGISSVITDVAGRRDVLHQRLTTGTAMLRWVGNGLHTTDYARIDAWVLRLKEWFEQGLEKAYIFLHEPDNLLAPEICVYFVEQVNSILDLNLEVPDLSGRAKQSTTGQMSLF